MSGKGGEFSSPQGRDEDLAASRAPTVSGGPPRDLPQPLPAKGLLPLGEPFGSYRLLRLLGQGGMGEVYEAEDMESGRRVALKVLSRRLDSPTDRERFLREGRLAAQVNHPHSVYVYGTEEIAGTSVISMELVPGGSLKDRVMEKGPLPVTGAVDATLQVISGLEAAAALGVLHRDIKPSNCFLDSDGTVKVGDFGLSISTVARDETHLTATGTFLGTPSFASPEQLRCEELDVRSDIYSVGATLYYLLTGRAPFEGQQIVKLLSTILQRPPESPRKLRHRIPGGLARAVLRCLAKDRSARFSSYAALRMELLPYSSTAARPATLLLRFLAGNIDSLVLSIPTWLYIDPTTRPDPGLTFSLLGVTILYFALFEGFWGASPGKALCRLRVVGPDRGVPGLARALLRASLFMGVVSLPAILISVLSAGQRPITVGESMAVTVSYFLLLASLFLTARRRNGFAGIHDLVSGTRVLRKPTEQVRPVMAESRSFEGARAVQPRIGPYLIARTLREADRERLLLGFDESLRRGVWVHVQPAGTDPVSPRRRDLSRPGTLRWLNGRRTPAEAWDAYEAPEGRAFLEIAGKPQPWSFLRHWLHDLVEELDAASKDGTLPPSLSRDRVWIARDGRAKLLDFAAPAASSESQPPAVRRFDPADFSSVRAFLHEFVLSAITGSPQAPPGGFPAVPPVPFSLSARSFVKSLSEPGSATFETLRDRLESFTREEARVSSWRRLGHLAASGSVGLFFFVVMLVGVLMGAGRAPDRGSFFGSFSRLQAIETGPCPSCAVCATDRRVLETYVAGHYRNALSRSPAPPALSQRQRELLDKALARHPASQPGELARASQEVKAILKRPPRGERKMIVYVVYVPAVMLGLTGILGLLSAILFRGGAVLRLFGMALVSRDGSEVSRGRALLRALVAWFPCFLFLALLPSIGRLPNGVGLAVLGLFVAGAVWAAATPERGPQDRIAGTFLVPR